MTRPNPSTFIVGAGPVATALAVALRKGGVPVLGIWARRAGAARMAGSIAGVAAFSSAPPDLMLEAEVIILAVRDDAIGAVTQTLLGTGLIGKRHVLLHCSGAWASSDVMSAAIGQVAGLGTLHPLRAIASAQPGSVSQLRGTTFGIEGDDLGRSSAMALATAMGGVPLELGGPQMAAYHAAAALASNYLVALLDVAAGVLAGGGITVEAARAALLPLATGALQNVAEHGLPDGLTGAIRRGDSATVERHLAALAAQPDVAKIYKLLAQHAVQIAAALPSEHAPSDDELNQVRKLVAG